jgi:hypothetical protein
MQQRYPSLTWTSDKVRRQISKIDQLASSVESNQLEQKQDADRVRSATDPMTWTSNQIQTHRSKRFDSAMSGLKAEKRLLENLLAVGEVLIDEGTQAILSAERSLEETGNRLTTELLKIAGLSPDAMDPQLLIRYQHQARSLPSYGQIVANVDQIKADVENIRRIHREAKARFLQIDDNARALITQELGI